MDYSEYLQGKYLFEGSPFTIPVSDDSKMRVIQNVVRDHMWVQDAIAMELITIGRGNPLARPDSIKRITSRFNIPFPDYANIGKGFGLGQFAINIAIRANEYGIDKTMLYLKQGDSSDIDTIFCINNLSILQRLFATDKTCADIFDFIQNNPPISSEFFRLGIEYGKLYFGMFFMFMGFQLESEFGKEKTNRIMFYGAA